MMKKFSIIVPVFFNELNLPETIPRLLLLEGKIPEVSLELVFVDDGSEDASLEILLDFRKRNPRKIKVVKLTKNFGSMAAIQAGFAVAGGDCVGVIAADLQDPPELFVKMIEEWKTGNKAVFAVREDRKDSFLKKYTSKMYYFFLKKLAIPNYPSGGFDFLLVDRQIVNEINQIQEKNTNLMSLIFWLGHRYVMIPYVRVNRKKGRSRWTFSKKIKLFIDSFVAFSYVPIRFLSFLGLVVAASSFVYAGVIFYVWLVAGIEVKGFTALALSLTFTAGIQMTMLGVLGEYLWRTLDETRKRPAYVIEKVYDEE